VKCLIEVYINFTSEFDHGHRPLRGRHALKDSLLDLHSKTVSSSHTAMSSEGVTLQYDVK